MSELRSLTYTRPRSLVDAMAALQRPGAQIYAGGTDLNVALYRREPWTLAVRELVDVKEVAEATGFLNEGDTTRIGALATASDVLDHASLLGSGALVEAAARTSAPTLRARGTVGGNLMTPHPCGDIATALLALDASVEVASDSGAVTDVSVESLLCGAVVVSEYPALLLSVRVRNDRSSAFESHGQRRAFCRSLCAVAVALHEGKHRVALGGLHSRPRLAPHVAAALDRGEDPSGVLARDVPDFPDARVTPTLLRALILRAHQRTKDRA